ncbi:hypothetical protein H072_10918 [Dactylellina haptotyla CBS 200.50]|uniref:Ig-like domain-containing protein n=1 Tax=Dactylellina haptotyla (strain CBS 200.50) TaxID=1284197 RepID=S8B972_DACHA|nr:hypothetical protein H072_10918 [Dactylellina haptotyla CBS 200.50]
MTNIYQLLLLISTGLSVWATDASTAQKQDIYQPPNCFENTCLPGAELDSDWYYWCHRVSSYSQNTRSGQSTYPDFTDDRLDFQKNCTSEDPGLVYEQLYKACDCKNQFIVTASPGLVPFFPSIKTATFLPRPTTTSTSNEESTTTRTSGPIVINTSELIKSIVQGGWVDGLRNLSGWAAVTTIPITITSGTSTYTTYEWNYMYNASAIGWKAAYGLTAPYNNGTSGETTLALPPDSSDPMTSPTPITLTTFLTSVTGTAMPNVWDSKIISSGTSESGMSVTTNPPMTAKEGFPTASSA